MNLKELENVIIKTFEDYWISKNEKYALRQIFADFKHDAQTLHFIRNRAFEIVNEQITNSNRYHLEAIKWLEQIIKTIDSVKEKNEQNVQYKATAYFSPGIKCANQIISLCKQAKISIDVCVFTISDDKISEELIKAYKRGVKVRIITDDNKSHDMGSDIYYFIEQGMKVKIDNSPSHMHHKFAVFDNKIMINGSFNWTRSASKNNNEDIVVNSNPDLIKSFSKRFEKLWASCVWVK